MVARGTTPRCLWRTGPQASEELDRLLLGAPRGLIVDDAAPVVRAALRAGIFAHVEGNIERYR